MYEKLPKEENFAKNIRLDPRLAACANFVRVGKNVLDIGTDHAFLPIYLVKEGVSSKVIASDINQGPLKIAKSNVNKFGCTGKIEVRLGSGFDGVKPCEFDDVVIAGMGGETIISIISQASFLKDCSKNLILQPMSKTVELREFLFKNNFFIKEEMAVSSNQKTYSVIKASYALQKFKVDKFYPYLGKLPENPGEDLTLYLKMLLGKLFYKLKGARASENLQKEKELQQVIDYILKLINKGG